jgi:DNA-binding response OmpR family regulator
MGGAHRDRRMTTTQGATATRARVLVIEDDPTVAEVVSRYLDRDGFESTAIANGRVGLDRALADPVDLVVLDLMLPGLGGLEICRALRASTATAVIMLTAKGSEDDRIAGLDLGADDYLTKPFSPRELMSRIKAVLRRAGTPLVADEAAPLVSSDLVVDTRAHEARLAGRPLSLTLLEFDLLAFLMRHPNQVFSREELLEQVWGYRYGDTSTVTVHVRRLREKIEADPADPSHVQTVWGIGYRFIP